jgi:hypothetical protein
MPAWSRSAHRIVKDQNLSRYVLQLAVESPNSLCEVRSARCGARPAFTKIRMAQSSQLLHPKFRTQAALRLILIRDGRAKRRENPVAGGLRELTLAAMDSIDHQRC